MVTQTKPVQASLRGMYRRRQDGCPHKHEMAGECPATCDAREGSACIYETAEKSKGCPIFRDIIHAWEKEIEAGGNTVNVTIQ